VVRYVALGDSYSIGTGVEPDQAWPRQLAARLTDLDLDLVANLAVNGSTADDVATEQMPDLESLAPQLASLLVGVNDVVQGLPEEGYGARVSEILDGMLQLLPASRVFAVATPDYTASRQGDAYGVPEQQRAAVLRNNEILRGACEYRGIAYVADTFEISAEISGNAGMLAADGLHPSAAQYARWVDAIEPAVRAMLALPSDDR
jgi:lysophospholipase L1-like esterase